jgi:hypothetical protein
VARVQFPVGENLNILSFFANITIKTILSYFTDVALTTALEYVSYIQKIMDTILKNYCFDENNVLKEDVIAKLQETIEDKTSRCDSKNRRNTIGYNTAFMLFKATSQLFYNILYSVAMEEWKHQPCLQVISMVRKHV